MTDLILSLDVTGREEALRIAGACAPEVDAIKVGYPLALAAGLGIGQIDGSQIGFGAGFRFLAAGSVAHRGQKTVFPVFPGGIVHPGGTLEGFGFLGPGPEAQGESCQDIDQDQAFHAYLAKLYLTRVNKADLLSS